MFNLFRRLRTGMPKCKVHYYHVVDMYDFGNKLVTDYHYKVECEVCGHRKWYRDRELMRRHYLLLLQVHNADKVFDKIKDKTISKSTYY